MKIGIVGLPNVGKSTLFNALTRSKGAMAANYPFCTIDPNVGVVEVPDERIKKLVALVKPVKVIPAIVEFVDIAGLVKGASEGEGLGNQFLAHIRECDAIAQVIRAFEDENIIHVHGNIDPSRDIEILETELILADLQTVQKRLQKAKNEAKSGDKKKQIYAELVEGVEKALLEGKKIDDYPMTVEEKEACKDLHLLTAKPIFYIANIGEKELGSFNSEQLQQKLSLGSDKKLIPISAKIEEELGELSEEEAKGFLQSLGLKETGLNSLIRIAYETLGLLTYFTAGPKEVRAWTIHKGDKAPQAAGVIHSDFEKGFISAEVIAYDDYIACDGETVAKEKGKMRVEGKNYEMCDGDVVHFRFNV